MPVKPRKLSSLVLISLSLLTFTACGTTQIAAPASLSKQVTSYQETLTVVQQWQGGFQANIGFKNTGTSPISSFTLKVKKPAGFSILDGWNATLSGPDAQGYYTFTSPSWLSPIAVGASYSIGFNGSGTFGATEVSLATVNGQPVGGTPTDTVAPTVPGTPTATNITTNSATLSWPASTDNVGVVRYEIMLGTTVLASSTTNSVNLTGLDAGVGYSLRIRARDAAGNVSALSNAVSFITKVPTDTLAPTAPTAVTVASITSVSAGLRWTASVDNVGVASYEVLNGTTVLATSTTNSVTVSGLRAATAYSLRVRAKDAAGNVSALSTAVNFTTSGAPLDSTPPTVSLSGSATSITTASTLNLTATAADNVGVTRVEFYRGTSLLSTDTTAPYNASLSITSALNGTHTFTAVAYDAAGNKTTSSAVNVSVNISTGGETPPGQKDAIDRYFPIGTSVDEMKRIATNLPKSEVKKTLYKEIDEHWTFISQMLQQPDKKKVYALFLGFATRESTLNAGVETAQEEGFGVNPAHAYGPFQTAVTAFWGVNPLFVPENDVPELYQYQFLPENFYDIYISNHMGVRKLVHFIRQAQTYGLSGKEMVRNALKGFNTGWANPENNPGYYAAYPDEIAAMGRWYYQTDHFYDDVFTWTNNPNVNRTNPWDWW